MTARHAPDVARTLTGLVTDRTGAARAVMAALTAAGTTGDERATVRSALTPYLHTPNRDALHDLTVDGYAAGARQAQRDVHALRKDDTASVDLMGVDWSTWEPGDVALAEKLLSGVNDAERLQYLLNESGVTIKSVAENRLGELARVIADGIGAGATTRDVTTLIAAVLDNPDRAEMVSRTETTRVMVAGAFDTYADAGVGWVSCLSAEDAGVCPLCTENEEAGVLSVWEQPPNGWPPTHPNCRCTVLPALGPNG